MAQKIMGTFATGLAPGAGATSDSLMIPTGKTAAVLNIAGGIDASNTVQLQKRAATTANDWSNVGGAYSSAQTDAPITVAAGEEFRLVLVTSQKEKAISYSLSVES